MIDSSTYHDLRSLNVGLGHVNGFQTIFLFSVFYSKMNISLSLHIADEFSPLSSFFSPDAKFWPSICSPPFYGKLPKESMANFLQLKAARPHMTQTIVLVQLFPSRIAAIEDC